MILAINGNISVCSINFLVFVVEMWFVVCEVKIQFLNTALMQSSQRHRQNSGRKKKLFNFFPKLHFLTLYLFFSQRFTFFTSQRFTFFTSPTLYLLQFPTLYPFSNVPLPEGGIDSA
jgi:hypothetical protein